MEEEHALPVRPGDDPRPGVAQPDCPVAAGRDEAGGEGLQRPQADPGNPHQRRAEPPPHRQRPAAQRGRSVRLLSLR